MWKKTVTLALLISLAGMDVHANALDEARRVIHRTNNTLQASQQTIDRADAQIMQMLAKYKTTAREIDNYLVYNRQLGDIVASQEDELRILQDDMAKVAAVKRQIMPFMQQMIDGLAGFIGSDLPFLPKERNTRIDTLNQNLKRSDLTLAAKFRQILEAYQIEIDYGNTIEAYEGDVADKKVDFLKIGRIGLYYLSPDKKTCAAWHPWRSSGRPWTISTTRHPSPKPLRSLKSNARRTDFRCTFAGKGSTMRIMTFLCVFMWCCGRSLRRMILIPCCKPFGRKLRLN